MALNPDRQAPWPRHVLWVYHREDGCDLEMYAESRSDAIVILRNFGVLSIDEKRLKEAKREPSDVPRL